MLTPLMPLWTVAMLIQVLLAVRIRHNAQSLQVFKIYIYFEAIIAPVAFVIFMLWPSVYPYIFISSSVITSILTLAIATDVYRWVFGPRMALPPMVPERTAQLVALAISGAVALAVFLPSAAGGAVRCIFMVEQTLSAAAWAVFLVLLIYSLSLKIAWPRDIAYLALGFILYLTIDVLAVFARARGNMEIQMAASTVSRIAYLLALSWWTTVFWHKEPAPTSITPEQVATMKKYHLQSIEALARSSAQRVTR